VTSLDPAAVPGFPASPLNHPLTWAHTADILLRLSFAFVLGSFVAHHPWRVLVARRGPRVHSETAQTQAIIAVAGALLVIVIGDSLARAFGLVGLGTFIRFRTGVKDPRDVAVLFVMIGIGMACGLGLVGTAAVGAAFVSAVLAVFDWYAPPQRRELRISVEAPDPASVRDAVRAAYPHARAVSVRRENGSARTSFSVEATDGQDALTILDSLQRHGAPQIEGVRIEEQ
jgi:uncharacterized membrane protein YhiD involved in acid resistance